MVRSGCRLGARVGVAAFVSLACCCLPAGAFPADQAVVPMAVGAAFALPAVAALAYYSIAGVVRLIGRLASLAAFVLVAVGTVEYLSPGLTRQLVDLAGLRWGT